MNFDLQLQQLRTNHDVRSFGAVFCTSRQPSVDVATEIIALLNLTRAVHLFVLL